MDLAIELQVMDGVNPLPGVYCKVYEEHGAFGLTRLTTDSEGVVRWGNLGAGRFFFEAESAELWPVRVPVEARPVGERVDVQLRRLGDLELKLFDGLGAPLRDAGFDLTSLEYGESVEDWVAAGRVSSSTGGLRSGSDGVVTLVGLPNGAYSWQLNGAQGMLQVAPQAQTTALINGY